MPSPSKMLGRTVAALPGGARVLDWAAQGSRANPNQRGVIFMLHRVLPPGVENYDPELAVSLPAFVSFLQWVRRHFQTVELAQLQGEIQRRQQAPPRAGARPLCALTFDDGWLDTMTHAFPALQRERLPATAFLPLRFIGGHRRFWQERLYGQLQRLRKQPGGPERLRQAGAAFPWCLPLTGADLDYARLRAKLIQRSGWEAEAFVSRLEEQGEAETPGSDCGRVFMDWDEVGRLQAAGLSFGSHTLNHAVLSSTPPAEADTELRASRQELGERLGAPVALLSYPSGGLSPFTRAQAARAGYGCAVTTQPGWVRADTDPLRLPRIAVSDAVLKGGTGSGPAGLQVRLARARRPRAAPPPPGAPPKLRIGVLVDNPEAWAPPPVRRFRAGSELQLLRMLEALPGEYFDCELYFMRLLEGGLPADLPWRAFSAVPAPGTGRWRTLHGLYRLLRQRRPAMVQTVFVDSLMLGVGAAWGAGVPAIVCSRRNAGYWKKWYHRAALRLINRMATAWLTNAASVAQLLQQQEHVPARGIEIMPNWLDLQRFAPADAPARAAARARLQLPADAFVAVCVANYRPVKDLTTLIEAAALAQARLPRLRLMLVGTGTEQQRLEQEIARLGVGGQVRLAGEQAQVEPYLAAADTGVLSSRSEGCSNAVLEYLAAGLPTVLSDIPANRALCTEGLFAPGDAAACAEELLRLAGDGELCAARGARNRRQAEAYGGEAFAARVQAHYLRVVGGVLRRRG